MTSLQVSLRFIGASDACPVKRYRFESGKKWHFVDQRVSYEGVAAFSWVVNLADYMESNPAEMYTVRKQTAQCSCCSRNRLIRLDEGRYQMGNRIYYLRRFRSHVMVRVGGGWLTLAQFLDRYDPCRQKEGKFHTLSSSHSNLAGNIIEPGTAVRISASKILKEWPSADPAVEENCSS
ncbi:hypothetical protein ACTXT7_002104 [Hymenolepis weldensis]